MGGARAILSHAPPTTSSSVDLFPEQLQALGQGTQGEKVRSDRAGMQVPPAGAGKMTTRGRAPTGGQLGLDGPQAPGGQGYILSLARKRSAGAPAWPSCLGLEPTLKAEFHVCYVASSPPLLFLSPPCHLHKQAGHSDYCHSRPWQSTDHLGVWGGGFQLVLHKKPI